LAQGLFAGRVIGTTRSPLTTDNGCVPITFKEDGKYVPVPPQKVERNRAN